MVSFPVPPGHMLNCFWKICKYCLYVINSIYQNSRWDATTVPCVLSYGKFKYPSSLQTRLNFELRVLREALFWHRRVVRFWPRHSKLLIVTKEHSCQLNPSSTAAHSLISSAPRSWVDFICGAIATWRNGAVWVGENGEMSLVRSAV